MLEKLACRIGKNDEAPNVELAKELSAAEDAAGIEEIVNGLKDKSTAVANDCIKVLYEIGTRKPQLIAAYAPEFIRLLHARQNRQVWGGMTALACIADLSAETIYPRLDAVLDAYRNGSVITVDQSISVFAKLCAANAEYAKTVFPILLKHLSACRPKEVPQHAERALEGVAKENAPAFIAVLTSRRCDLSPAQARQVNRVIQRARTISAAQ